MFYISLFTSLTGKGSSIHIHTLKKAILLLLIVPDKENKNDTKPAVGLEFSSSLTKKNMKISHE